MTAKRREVELFISGERAGANRPFRCEFSLVAHCSSPAGSSASNSWLGRPAQPLAGGALRPGGYHWRIRKAVSEEPHPRPLSYEERGAVRAGRYGQVTPL